MKKVGKRRLQAVRIKKPIISLEGLIGFLYHVVSAVARPVCSADNFLLKLAVGGSAFTLSRMLLPYTETLWLAWFLVVQVLVSSLLLMIWTFGSLLWLIVEKVNSFIFRWQVSSKRIKHAPMAVRVGTGVKLDWPGLVIPRDDNLIDSGMTPSVQGAQAQVSGWRTVGNR